MRLPSTSSMIAPSALATNTGVAWNAPRTTAVSRRRMSSLERGPGIAVRSWIAGISVPPDWLLVEIDVYLLGLEILFDTPRSQLAPETGLLITAPRGFDVSGLHVVDPHDSRPQ